MINIVRTKGKAGYFVWKLAGGQGDPEINLPWGSFIKETFFELLNVLVSCANPLLIIYQNLILTKTALHSVELSKLKLPAIVFGFYGNWSGSRDWSMAFSSADNSISKSDLRIFLCLLK